MFKTCINNLDCKQCMVITFANDGVQIFQTKFHKDMPQWNYHGIPIYHHLPNNCVVNNFMGHSHHFPSIDILQTCWWLVVQK
jgi:hypothetical protein